MRSLVKLRCENFEEVNKSWLEKSEWRCIFCGKDKDNIEHYVIECEELKGRFDEL